MFTKKDKGRVADAAHQAVLEVIGGTGSHRCLHYAHAGRGLLEHLGIKAQVRVGTLYILDERGKYAKTVKYGGLGGENDFYGHAWLTVGGDVIDFSARHFPDYAKGTDYRRIPPDYLWGDTREWAKFKVAHHQDRILVENSVFSAVLMVAAMNAWEGVEKYELVDLGTNPDGTVTKGIARRRLRMTA